MTGPRLESPDGIRARLRMLLSLVTVAVVSGCGTRLPPPPPAPGPVGESVSHDPGDTPERDRALEDVRVRPRFSAPEEPLDEILSSRWAGYTGIQEGVEAYLGLWEGRGREYFSRYLQRMGQYVDFVDSEIAARGLPPSLRYLPVIEAGYYPGAVSRVGAAGLWQFMPPTARWLGLEVSQLIDERRDPWRSTPKALDYLVDLHEQFGSWFLALAAYNSGPGRIERVIARYAPDARRDDALFWTLRPYLPQETRDFVPKFLAAVRIAESPDRHGFGDVRPFPLLADTVRVPDATSLDVVARAAGVDQETIELLNPQVIRGRTPRDQESLVRVPRGTAERFAARYAEIPASERVSFTEHRVARGETFTHIGRSYGVSISELAAANPGVSPRRLQIGQRLIVPIGANAPDARAVSTAGSANSSRSGPSAPESSAAVRAPSRPDRRTHVVGSGESLWGIARLYGVQVSELRDWNGLGATAVIHPGQRLELRRVDVPIYRVRSGDTLSEIALRHGVSTMSLLRFNGLGERSVIRPGDQVMIPPTR